MLLDQVKSPNSFEPQCHLRKAMENYQFLSSLCGGKEQEITPSTENVEAAKSELGKRRPLWASVQGSRGHLLGPAVRRNGVYLGHSTLHGLIKHLLSTCYLPAGLGAWRTAGRGGG